MESDEEYFMTSILDEMRPSETAVCLIQIDGDERERRWDTYCAIDFCFLCGSLSKASKKSYLECTRTLLGQPVPVLVGLFEG